MSSSSQSSVGETKHGTTISALLVWVYQRQKADVMSGRGLWTPEAELEAAEEGFPVRRWSGCGCAQLAAIARLGARIDSGGWQRAVLHSDAEMVHDAVIELSRRDWAGAMLLRRYGRAGGAPEWDIRQEFEPVRDERDRIVQNNFEESFLLANEKGRMMRIPARYCPVEKYPSDAWVEMARGEYRIWWRALKSLADALSGSPMKRWSIVGLGARQEPWNDGVAEKIAHSKK